VAGAAALVTLVAGAVLGAGRTSTAASRRVQLRIGGTVPPGPRAARRHGRRASADPSAALSAAVTAVAAELRAGRSAGEAWHAVLGVATDPDGTPRASDVLAAVAPRMATRRGGGRANPRPEAAARALLESRVAGVLAATRLAGVVGAPLAGVLDGCARSLSADAEAESGVRAALAGPTQTTTLLTWLPAVGVGLGVLLGADPLGVLLDGGVGTAAGVTGGALTVAGRAWVARMVAAARGAGLGDADG
jgi:tight adherence protein B